MTVNPVRALAWLGLATALLSIGFYLPAVRPYIGGDDFFYLFCSGRDLAFGILPGTGDAAYFPGIYRFWWAVYLLSDGSVDAAQWTYLCMVLLNAALVGGIVFRVCRNGLAATFAVVWFMVLYSRFEGFYGVAEPIATIPLLIAILVWGGHDLRGRKGLARSLVLAAGIGCSMYIKQQAGLLSIGAVALLIHQSSAAKSPRSQWRYILLLPVFSAAFFLAAIVSEGRGLAPLRQGLNAVSEYQQHGEWWMNLCRFAFNDLTFSFAMVASAGGWIWLIWRDRSRELLCPTTVRVAAFGLAAAGASLVQYFLRGYAHYALLAVPGVVIAGVLLAHQAPALPARSRMARSAQQAGLILCAVALLGSYVRTGNSSCIQVWHSWPYRDFVPHDIWSLRPAVAADLARLAPDVKPGQSMQVIPLRRIAPYLHFKTRILGPGMKRIGSPFDWQQMPWDTLEYALVITSDQGQPAWTESRGDEALDDLRTAGFQVLRELETMTLFQRTGHKHEDLRD